MMKTCVIKQTGASHGASGMAREIKYIGDGTTKAHDLNILPKSKRKLNLYNKRNLILGGVGIRTTNGYKATLNDFKKLAKKKPHNKVRTLNFVISPEKGTVNPSNYEQLSAFRDFCEDYAKEAFPHHLAYIAIQWDNWKRDSNGKLYGGIPHAHLIVSALSTLPPYKTMTGNEYHMTRLKRLYNQERLIFDRKQNAIKLGPSTLWKNNTVSPRFLFATEIYQNTQDIMNNLEAGKYHNKTELKNAFKNKGIIIKFHDFRHRKYIYINNNGRKKKKYVYRKYQTGKRKGQYMWRKSKHGRHKVPVYTHTYGITFHHNKSMGQRKRQYAKGSDMLDNRFNYQYIMNCLNHASELKRKHKLEDYNKWKTNQALRKQGPIPSIITSNSSNSSSADPLSASYQYSYGSAVSTISASGVDLASITPRPLSSVSYNPLTERALASVANAVTSASPAVSSGIQPNSGGVVASGATTENGLHEEYKVGNFMPKLSKSKVQQGAYLSMKNIYPEYLVDKKTGKHDNNVIFHDFDFNQNDISLINDLFSHLSKFVKQTAKSADDKFIKMHDILHKKAHTMKNWLDERGLGLLINTRARPAFLNLHDVFNAKDTDYKHRLLSKNNDFRTRIKANYPQSIHYNILVNIKEAHNQISNKIHNIRARWLQKKREAKQKQQEKVDYSKAVSYYDTPEGKLKASEINYHRSMSQATSRQASQQRHRSPQGPTLG